MSDDVTFVDRRARELASDPTLNVALEASAGTGKTRVLVERYVHLIERGASPRHVLAITFTRKAAGEMRTRIIDELRKRPALWKDIRSRLFEIHVTTIDAFCLGLLREFPLEAGLDPDLTLIDTVDTERLLEESIEEVMAETRRGQAIDIRFLFARFGEGLLRRGIREFLSSRLLKAEILDRYVARVIPRNVSLTAALRRLSESLDRAFRGAEGVEQFLATGPSPLPPALRALAFALRRAVDPDRIASADVEEVAEYFLTRTKEPRRRLSRTCGKEAFGTRADYETHREAVLGLAPLVARAYNAWLTDKDFYAIRELNALYRKALERFTELKAARAGLDFNDVLIHAVSLLENRGEFSESRFRLESRYHHLLIDEFQDTNEVQWRLVHALIESWGEGQGLVQEAILSEQAAGVGTGSLREPSLFIVGDRKQSIYGWRDARVEVLEKAARHLLKIRRNGGRRLTLRTSFRAGGELLSFLNDLFDALPKVRRDLDWSFQYREEDHFPIPDGSGVRSPVALAAGTDLESVAAAVADETVRVLTEEGRRPKDIAILFRSRSSYRIYEEALSARGVPAYVYRGLGFFDSPEVRDIGALVRYLAEPASELRSAELARSRFIGISDRALVSIASSRGSSIARWLSGAPISSALPLSSEDRDASERARRLVPEWVRRVDRIPPADLMERILEETEYAAWFVDAEQSWENLKKVLEIVRRAENRGYLTLSRLADYLESASTEEESPAVLDAVDAVNLMTVHAAKGLEFDTVFLVNMHQRTRKDTSLPRIRELPDGRVEVSALAATEPAGDLPNRVEEEEKRLLYVALTRARRNLVLSSLVTEEAQNEPSFFRLLPESLRALFAEAARSDPRELTWGAHTLSALGPVEGRTYREERPERAYQLRLEPLEPDTAVVSESEDAFRRDVHLLFECGAGAAIPEGEAGDFYQELSRRDDLARLRERGAIHYRVPFSVADGRRIRRGTIGCLIVGATGLTVLDFRRTGLGDIALQLRAAQEAFPGRPAEAVVFYPDHEPEKVKPASGDSPKDQLPLF